jgi:hypothetical protein
MILRSSTEHENGGFVMPAWMAGIHVRKDASGDIHATWIPALHAGMTQSRSRTKTDRGPPSFLFSKEIAKDTKPG